MVVQLEHQDHAILLASRCILIKSVCEFYAQGSSYDELHAAVRSNKQEWIQHQADASFKFTVTGFKCSLPAQKQREIIESFSYMALAGKIDLKTPDIILSVFEEYDSRVANVEGKHEQPNRFKQVYFGRLLVEGTARSLAAKFDVKKRVYYGNTSMEAEISLLMANQTLASSGKLVYDPFMGTGSMAYTVAHFGAQMFGSDIDGRQMRGKEKQAGVFRAAAQYGVAARVVDLCTFDVTHNPWRCGDLFDAIVTDPPYGVRAGAKRLGRKKPPTEKHIASLSSQRVGALRPGDSAPYIPPTKPYELSNLASDLVLLARYLLRPGGRLVFFLPTVNEDYQEVDIRTMLCEGMEVVANSLQDFGSWGRRLITLRKTTNQSYDPPTFEAPSEDVDELDGETAHVPAHKDFREKYFQGFKPAAE